MEDEAIQPCILDPATAPIAEAHRKVLLFATKAARDPNSLTDDDLEDLRARSLSDGELVEVAMTVAFTKLMNTWAGVTGIIPGKAPAPQT